MGKSPERILVVTDAEGRRPHGSAGAPEAPAEWKELALPRWADSTLSRAMRLHGLTDEEVRGVEERASELMAALHDALTAEGTTEGEWQYLRQVLETHAVTPMVEAAALVRHAVDDGSADGLRATADLRRRDWWAGQARAAWAALAVGRERGLAAEVRYEPAWAVAALRALGALGPAAERVRPRLLRRRGMQVLARAAMSAVPLAPEAGRAPRAADVLLLASGPVVERLVLAVAGRLAEMGVTCELARDPLAETADEEGRFLVLGAMAGRPPLAEARRLLREGPARAQRELVRLGHRVTEAELAGLAPRLAGLECRDRPLLRWLMEDAEGLLDAVQPRALVAFHFLPRLATPYLVAARRRGVATICCQHGLMAGLDYDVPWYDECLVFNGYSAEQVGAAVGPGTQVTVVGNPALDGLAQKRAASEGRHDNKGAHGAEAGTPQSVLVATQPTDPPGSEANAEWWFRVVARACAAAGATTTVKLHPQQDAEVHGAMYSAAMARDGAQGEVIAHGQADLHELITKCDAFVSQFSTSLLDALALGKPTIFVELRDGPAFYPFDDFGAARRVTRAEDMEPALRQALEGGPAAEERRDLCAFAARHLAPMDGRALSRIAEAIAARAEGKGAGGEDE